MEVWPLAVPGDDVHRLAAARQRCSHCVASGMLELGDLYWVGSSSISNSGSSRSRSSSSRKSCYVLWLRPICGVGRKLQLCDWAPISLLASGL